MTGITTDEYRSRVKRIQDAMRDSRYDALILFADSTRSSNVRYVVDFKPIDGYSDISMAIVLLPVESDPTLFVSQMNLLWAEEVSWFSARPFREMAGELVILRSKLDKGKVGITGLNFMPIGVYEAIKGVFGMSSISIANAETLLGRIKAKKSATEIKLLRKAGELTMVGLDAIKKAACSKDPRTEREIAFFATQEMLAAGGEGPSFDIQIQSGPHSAYNNIRSTDRLVSPGDSILIEMGAKYRGYVTDIARGATISPVDKRQVEIIEVAAATLNEGCQAIAPGITANELNTVIEKALTKAGYLEYSDEARGYGTGHGIGTDIEEEEPWIKPGSEFVLEENMVFAFKASIFIPKLAGVRIEDVVLVTKNGYENLTPYPRVLTW